MEKKGEGREGRRERGREGEGEGGGEMERERESEDNGGLQVSHAGSRNDISDRSDLAACLRRIESTGVQVAL